MELLAWKLRVSTLWIYLGVGMLAGMFVVILEPGVLDQYIATGEVEGEKFDFTVLALMLMLFGLVPLAMAFLTQVMTDPVNRYANAVLGVVATVMWAWDLADHSSKGLEIGALLLVTLIIAGLLIIWHAWRWPKQAGSTV